MIPAVSAATGGGAGFPYQWVAIGNTGALYTSTSTTASSWTSRTSSFGTTLIKGIASNGTNLYVACGASGKLATSPDGTNWTQRTSGTTVQLYQVAYGNGYWFVVGSNITTTNYYAYSTDGITWTANSSGFAGASAPVAVAYGNGVWTTLHISGEVYSTTNPTGTWTARTSTLSSGSNWANHYAKTQAVWVQGLDGGTTGALQYSSDATNWNSANSPVTVDNASAVFTSNSSVIVCGVSKSGATIGDIITSTNGSTWTDRTPAVTSSDPRGAASDPSDLLVILMYTDGGVQTSSDGTTWTSRGTIASGFVPQGLCHSSGVPSIR